VISDIIHAREIEGRGKATQRGGGQYEKVIILTSRVKNKKIFFFNTLCPVTLSKLFHVRVLHDPFYCVAYDVISDTLITPIGRTFSSTTKTLW
jgi:hypothetical protein